VFRKVYNASNKTAVLTTYCAKGDVRRTLNTIGFYVEKIPGPPGGKRDMTRAKKSQ
jgi:tRNA U34 5-methylaminomethyl-2-thiouridine-forming methyltransferase MnmC